MYYVCDYETQKVMYGPYPTAFKAAEFIIASTDQRLYCTMSRYRLAKAGIYPNTVAGDSRLMDDLQAMVTA